ncbi:hypothetical protein [Ramlibacter montanisoli]|uniref:hypothetical protein n=1 Tax=Ramlibacter montanisoli TaxID=2732512 RepID=UPI0035A0ABFA
MATAFDVSENHLVKVVHFLGKQGWLANVRGKGGGLSWARRRRRSWWAAWCARPKARPWSPSASAKAAATARSRPTAACAACWARR